MQSSVAAIQLGVIIVARGAATFRENVFLVSIDTHVPLWLNKLHVHAKLLCLLEYESFGSLPCNCFAAVEFCHREQEEIVVQ